MHWVIELYGLNIIQWLRILHSDDGGFDVLVARIFVPVREPFWPTNYRLTCVRVLLALQERRNGYKFSGVLLSYCLLSDNCIPSVQQIEPRQLTVEQLFGNSATKSHASAMEFTVTPLLGGCWWWYSARDPVVVVVVSNTTITDVLELPRPRQERKGAHIA